MVDAPFYQLFSNNIDHVKRHFPGTKIKSKILKAISINDFLSKYFQGKKINYFSTKEGRKEIVNSIKKEIRKANDRENYLDDEERILIKNFIEKIKKELELKN